MNRRGRRPSLATGYFVAALGSIVVVMAAIQGSIPLLLAGFFLFGAATAAGLQARCCMKADLQHGINLRAGRITEDL